MPQRSIRKTDVPAMRIGLIGPLPPPSGGMANQTRQLVRLLRSEGLDVELVQTNAPYKPGWVGKLHGIRALFRLLPYIWKLFRATGRVDLFHIMANSGWSWHLYAAPAIWVGWLRNTPVIVNYRGGEAEVFFRKSFHWVQPSLKRVAAVIVPSGFLAEVFRSRGIDIHIVKNIVDLKRFTSNGMRSQQWTESPHLLVTRNLEAIYDIGTALRAFQRVLAVFPSACLTVCGSGPEREMLVAQAEELGLGGAVTFTGRLDNNRMTGFYQSADVMINPSLADNMPISILEALACGVPVVSTNVGGVPYLVNDGVTALLVPPGDDEAMAEKVISVLKDKQLATSLSLAGLDEIRKYTWQNVREKLFVVYDSVLEGSVNVKTGEHNAP